MDWLSPFKKLTAFEKMLWLSSVAAVWLSFLVPKEKDVLNLIASLIGATALIFVAKGYVIGQILSVVFSVFYGIISFYFGYYGEMITYLGMTSPIAVMSVISWLRHPYDRSGEVAVAKLTRKLKIILIITAPLVTFVFYFILKALSNTNLFFSTLSVTTSYTAAYLVLFRSPFYAIAYSANDVVLIILWILASFDNISYLPMVFCFVIFLFNDMYGFYNWRRMQLKQGAE